jgi:hypothetical protein
MMRKVNLGLVMLAVMVFLALPSFGQAGDPNLVAYWALDEGTGTVAYDSAGGNDGNLVGDPCWTSGQIGGALSFDGSGDYVDCGTGLVLAEVSVCAWVKTINDAGQLVFSKKGSSSGGHEAYSLVTGDLYHGSVGTVLTRIKQAGSVNFIDLKTTKRIDDGQWHFIAMSYDGTVATLYIDGESKVTSAPGGPINYASETKKASIGATRSTDGSPAGFFNGLIDEVMIFNRALSVEEVERIYWEGIAGLELAIFYCGYAIAEKAAALESIDASLGKEWAAYGALEELLESKDYGDLRKSDIIKARQRIHSAIQHQEQSAGALERGVEQLGDALEALGVEPEPEPNIPEPNMPVPNSVE